MGSLAEACLRHDLGGCDSVQPQGGASWRWACASYSLAFRHSSRPTAMQSTILALATTLVRARRSSCARQRASYARADRTAACGGDTIHGTVRGSYALR